MYIHCILELYIILGANIKVSSIPTHNRRQSPATQCKKRTVHVSPTPPPNTHIHIHPLDLRRPSDHERFRRHLITRRMYIQYSM